MSKGKKIKLKVKLINWKNLQQKRNLHRDLASLSNPMTTILRLPIHLIILNLNQIKKKNKETPKKYFYQKKKGKKILDN